MLILPAIDLMDGRVVRLRQGRFEEAREYDDDPTRVAARYVERGYRELHLVSLDGARAGKIVPSKELEALLAFAELRVQCGGGVRSEDDVRWLIDRGASRVVVGSVAASSPALVAEWGARYGADRITVALDGRDGKVVVRGWQDATEIAIASLMGDLARAGLRRFLVTSVERDGEMSGPDVALYESLRRAVPEAELLASGGIRSQGDLERLESIGMFGAVVGRAMLEGEIV